MPFKRDKPPIPVMPIGELLPTGGAMGGIPPIDGLLTALWPIEPVEMLLCIAIEPPCACAEASVPAVNKIATATGV
jgi:hypothetical protein